MKHVTNPLELLSFYHFLSIPERELLTQNATQMVIRDNKEFQLCETIHNGLILVIQGQLNIFSNLLNGRQMALFNIPKNQFALFYDQALLIDKEFDVSLSIDHAITIVHINTNIIQRIINNNTEVAALVYQHISKNLICALLNFEKRISLTLSERIMTFIDKQMQIQDSHVIKVSHERIANELGSSREVITKILNELAKKNMISLKKGMIIVHNN